MRKKVGVDSIRPGITGWAQVNGRDEIPLSLKVQFDSYYVQNQSLWLDLKIFIITFSKVILSKDVKH